MAFYTSRMSEKLNDDARYSARSLSSSVNCGSSYFNLSSRSFDTSTTTYRHVNPAVFIDDGASLTDVSIEDNKNSARISETHSNIVPPLDLKSEDNYPIRDYTFSYRKHCEAAKIVLKPDKAYETWLSAKRKILSDEASRRKKEEEMKQKVIEERKRLAREKYNMWLQKKSQTSIGSQSITNHVVKPESNLGNGTRSKMSVEEARTRLEEWEREKRLKDEHRRMIKRQEEQRQRKLEEQRRQMSVEAWENWIANADKKPKPVPLNRGIFTLRGTVNDIFVNPNKWEPIVPTSNEDDE